VELFYFGDAVPALEAFVYVRFAAFFVFAFWVWYSYISDIYYFL